MTKEENNIIEIVDESGEVIICEVFTIIEFEEKEYALLIPKNQKDDPEADFVVMRIEEEGEEISFVDLDDDEFERVSEYIENMEDDDED